MALTSTLSLLVATVLVAVCAKEIKLPSNFFEEHVCSRNDPKIETCLLKVLEDLKPYVKGGLPQYNLPAMDPHVIPELIFELGELKATAKNIVLHGASNYKFNKLKVSADRLTYKMEFLIPELHYEYDYDIDVSLALIPIKGFGSVRGNVSDIKANLKMIGTIEDHKDGKHLTFKKVDVNVDVGDRFVKFNNLYKGITLLTEATNDLINANSRQLNMLGKPLRNHIIATELPKLFKKVTDTVLFDNMLPDT